MSQVTQSYQVPASGLVGTVANPDVLHSPDVPDDANSHLFQNYDLPIGDLSFTVTDYGMEERCVKDGESFRIVVNRCMTSVCLYGDGTHELGVSFCTAEFLELLAQARAGGCGERMFAGGQIVMTRQGVEVSFCHSSPDVEGLESVTLSRFIEIPADVLWDLLEAFFVAKPVMERPQVFQAQDMAGESGCSAATGDEPLGDETSSDDVEPVLCADLPDYSLNNDFVIGDLGVSVIDSGVGRHVTDGESFSIFADTRDCLVCLYGDGAHDLGVNLNTAEFLELLAQARAGRCGEWHGQVSKLVNGQIVMTDNGIEASFCDSSHEVEGLECVTLSRCITIPAEALWDLLETFFADKPVMERPQVFQAQDTVSGCPATATHETLVDGVLVELQPLGACESLSREPLLA